MAGRPARVDERQLTIREAAARLNVSEKTVRRRIAQGILPAYRHGPRMIRINPADLPKTRQRIPAASSTTAADLAA